MEIGAAPVLRRLGLGALASRASSETIDWSSLHCTSTRADTLQLSVPRAAIRHLPLEEIGARPGRRFSRIMRARRHSALLALAAVAGPGLLAGLSDDDPAGIATNSILGADYGYELLWVLLLSTVALVIFHEAGARMGVATGQGLMGLIRERYGVRLAAAALIALLLANLGTTCAEFAGIAASLQLAGVSKYLSVPLAALGVSLLVLWGGFHRIEHVLLALDTVFAVYILAGFLPARLGRSREGSGDALDAVGLRSAAGGDGDRRHHPGAVGHRLH